VIRQAFVLGAGLGTRLKALTQHRPKPLIPVCNRPLIAYGFDHLRSVGVERFVINTHWRAEAYAREFPEPFYQGCPLHFRHEAPEVLETAGGIKNAEDLLMGEAFWVYNGDILCTLPLAEAEQAHRARGHEVTLVLRSKDGPLQVAWDAATGRVLDLGRQLVPGVEPGHLFTGISIVEPEFLCRIPPREKISVVPIFREMIREGARLGAVVIDEGRWFDLGTRDQILEVHRELANGWTHPGIEGRGPWIDASAEVAPDASILGATAIGAGAKIERGAVVRDSVVWPGAHVGFEAEIERCIVATGFRAEGKLAGVDVA
jgi:NDP-sugar pyrophosphorylase family protein